MLRVLRQGGKLVASTWAEGGSSPTDTAGEILDRYAGPVDTLDEESWFAGQHGSDILRHAGFTSVSVQTESFSGEFADAEDVLAWLVAWPLAAARLARLDPDRQQGFFSEARGAHGREALVEVCVQLLRRPPAR